jgi:predicted HicB family RNase H-like nuclease
MPSNTQVNVRMAVALYNRVLLAAESMGISISEYIRRALEAFLDTCPTCGKKR